MRRSHAPEVLVQLLDTLGYPVLVADANGRVLHETPALRAILGTGAGGDALLAALRGAFQAAPCAGDRVCAASSSEPRDRHPVRVGTACFVVRSTLFRWSHRAPPLRLVCVERAPATPRSRAELSCAFGLTPAEARVAALLAEGKSNAEIAAALSISPHTARRHTERILFKLGARSRAEIAGRLA